MKKQPLYRLFLNLLLLVSAQGAVMAQTTQVVDGGVVYQYDFGDWVITGINPVDDTFPTNGIITLKSSIEVDVFGDGNKVDVDVTEIVNQAFQGQTAIKGVTIQEGLQTIGQDAFDGCTNLPYLVLPSTITTVGSNAFGRDMRWVDCRIVKEENWSDDLLNPFEVKIPDELGSSDYTLYYMPDWCDKSNYNYPNAVLTDDSGNRTCAEFRFSRNMD